MESNQVTITISETRTSYEFIVRPYTEYKITTRSDLNESTDISIPFSRKDYEVWRRFREFEALREQILQEVPEVSVPTLEQTGLLENKNDLKVVDQRKSLLTDFLSFLLHNQQTKDATCFRRFLLTE